MAEKVDINFLGVISFIGAILVLVGVAWIVASNWHVIPSLVKIVILVAATVAALVFGEIAKEKGYEFSGRSILLLGGGLYVLSVFLISQIFGINAVDQGFVNLILLCWPALFLIAYFLDSIENVIAGFVIFGMWVIGQYSVLTNSDELGITLILLFILIGMILYSLKQLHKTFNHRFYRVYTFWTVFYILLGTFLLTFQAILAYGVIRPRGGLDLFNPFFIFIAIAAVVFFAGSISVSLSKNKKDIKEIAAFGGIIVILLFSVLLFYLSGNFDLTDQKNGYCFQDYNSICYGFRNADSCNEIEGCKWQKADGYCDKNFTVESKGLCGNIEEMEFCYQITCSEPVLDNQSNCEKMKSFGCYWQENGICGPEGQETKSTRDCHTYSSLEECEAQSNCMWRTDYGKVKLNWFSYILWLLYNLMFVGLIIAVIWYGKEEGQRRIIDLAFLFFIVEIISRYIGFMMNLDGYLAFSVGSIFGGLLLIFGSYYIQKYWRQEVGSVKNEKKK